MQEYDVIIVGAGNGGLLAATNTTKNGLKTLVIEKHNLPGGSATSFRRGRFEFEASLHEFAAWGIVHKKMFADLGIDLDLLEVEDTFRVIIPGKDGFDVAMPKGRDAFINKMEEVVPGSNKSMNDFFDLCEEMFSAINYFGSTGGKPSKITMLKKYKNFLKMADQSIEAVMNALDMPLKAQQILSSYWCYIGMPIDVFEAIHYMLLIMYYVEDGAYVPRMRSHEMSLAIEKCIYNNGGSIWYNTEVEKILVKNGKAYGVATKDGEIYAKAVICNISPRNVFGYMMDKNEIPERALKLENARKLGTSAFTLYLGLNRSPEELGIKDYSLFMYGTSNSNEEFNSMHTLDENNGIVMNCVNIANPGCSPEGTSILWATQLYYGDAWSDVTPENYKEIKNKIANKIIKRYEELSGITISPYIEEVVIATPPTFARYLGTPNGSIYGYQGQKWDSMMARTLAMSEENTIEGLRFCGGFGTQMDGFSSAYRTGNMAGQATVKYIKKEAQ